MFWHGSNGWKGRSCVYQALILKVNWEGVSPQKICSLQRTRHISNTEFPLKWHEAKCIGMVCTPYALIVLPLAAVSTVPGFPVRMSIPVAGKN